MTQPDDKRKAHSKSEMRRLEACGVKVEPPDDKPRELKLVKLRSKPWQSVSEHNAICYSKDGHEILHVIEHSAYLAVKAERDELKVKLKEFDEYYTFQNLERIEIENKKLRAELDAFKAALVIKTKDENLTKKFHNTSGVIVELKKERDQLRAELDKANALKDKAADIAISIGFEHNKFVNEHNALRAKFTAANELIEKLCSVVDTIVKTDKALGPDQSNKLRRSEIMVPAREALALARDFRKDQP